MCSHTQCNVIYRCIKSNRQQKKNNSHLNSIPTLQNQTHNHDLHTLDDNRVERERGIIDSSAGAAHLHGGIGPAALHAVLGSDIRAADLFLLGVRAQQSDVSLLAPKGGPGVAHQPVLAGLVLCG